MNQTVKYQKIKFSREQVNLPKIMNNSPCKEFTDYKMELLLTSGVI